MNPGRNESVSAAVLELDGRASPTFNSFLAFFFAVFAISLACFKGFHIILSGRIMFLYCCKLPWGHNGRGGV